MVNFTNSVKNGRQAAKDLGRSRFSSAFTAGRPKFRLRLDLCKIILLADFTKASVVASPSTSSSRWALWSWRAATTPRRFGQSMAQADHGLGGEPFAQRLGLLDSG
jgi:hypothetical protein